MVFLLWGGYARKKAALVTNPQHVVLEAGHPSPMNPRGFLGSRPFSAANKALADAGLPTDRLGAHRRLSRSSTSRCWCGPALAQPALAQLPVPVAAQQLGGAWLAQFQLDKRHHLVTPPAVAHLDRLGQLVAHRGP